jgi:hypothetical protein
MENTFDAIIHQWFLVTLCNSNQELIGNILWGIVIDDQKRRFEQGHYVCTSQVIEQISPSLFRTMNTTYKCEGEGEKVTMGVEHFQALREGFSPTKIQTLIKLQPKLHRI